MDINFLRFFIVIPPVANSFIYFDEIVGLFGTVQGDAGLTLAELGCPIWARLSPSDKMSRGPGRSGSTSGAAQGGPKRQCYVE